VEFIVIRSGAEFGDRVRITYCEEEVDGVLIADVEDISRVAADVEEREEQALCDR
jgi:hypothetical protein